MALYMNELLAQAKDYTDAYCKQYGLTDPVTIRAIYTAHLAYLINGEIGNVPPWEPEQDVGPQEWPPQGLPTTCQLHGVKYPPDMDCPDCLAEYAASTGDRSADTEGFCIACNGSGRTRWGAPCHVCHGEGFMEQAEEDYDNGQYDHGPVDYEPDEFPDGEFPSPQRWYNPDWGTY